MDMAEATDRYCEVRDEQQTKALRIAAYEAQAKKNIAAQMTWMRYKESCKRHGFKLGRFTSLQAYKG